MDKFQIETAQNVTLSQNTATIGDRIIAYMVDGLIIVAYVLLVLFISSSLDLPDSSMWFLGLTIGLPIFLYHLLWETLWDGRSPGKAIAKIRVVMLDGSKPELSNFLLRWILRTIDISITSGALAIVTILLNGRGQRVGDIAAKTTVISEKQKITIHDTLVEDIEEGYVPTYSQVILFTDAEMQTIKNLYQQALRNRNHNVILKLAERIEAVLEIKPVDKPKDFIDCVIKDYNYYTQQ